MKWEEIDQQACSVARALSVLGERWTLLIIRDAFRGTRRFDEFQRSLGVTRHRLSERLRKLVDQGVLTRVAYMERPVRHEYRLTRKGLALYPVLMTLSQWGDDWMDDGNGPPQSYRHSVCGQPTRAILGCDYCGEPVRPEEVSPQMGAVLSAYVAHLKAQGEPLPSAGELAREATHHWQQAGERGHE
jgi:DNA-binding HxlR family transcriptional regulator